MTHEAPADIFIKELNKLTDMVKLIVNAIKKRTNQITYHLLIKENVKGY